MTDKSPLSAALAKHKVSAVVKDLDHHRIGGGFAVETDYIIKVEPKSDVTLEESFATFKLSKTYSAFRTLASQLKKVAERAAKKEKHWDSLPADVKQSIKFAESVSHLVQTQRTQYLGKVNLNYVKSVSQQRSQTINDVLESILQNYPAKASGPSVVEEIAGAIELFFLTDHVDEDDASTVATSDDKSNHRRFTPGKGAPIGDFGKFFQGNKKKEEEPAPRSIMSPVVPVSRKHRKSVMFRAQDEAELLHDDDQPKLFLDDDRDQKAMLPSYSAPVPVVRSNGSKLTEVLETDPYVFMLITLVLLVVLRSASFTQVTIDTDIFLLVVFAFFCLGFHLPRATRMGVDVSSNVPAPPVVTFKRQSSRRRSSDVLLRKSMLASPKAEEDMQKAWEEVMEEEDAPPLIQSPMEIFPEGAALGSKFNCWSQPKYTDFHVRGPKYKQNKKKIPSGDFIFPCRGVDLFLTDLSPENVGSISGVMGGVLRELPTFIVNYRLPWGVLLYYFEIPERFLPFIHKQYEPTFDDSTLPSLDDMSPADRTVARFLMGDDKYKNDRLKIVPVVVEGPWVVKSVVGGKPAIIGTKLPVNYVYQPQDGEKALYLEADLDIVASSAARGILSVVRSYTSGLTMDMGYVVQGNEEDELPECMLTGTRMHGIDPLTAPPLPPMKDLYMGDESEARHGSP